MQQLDLRRLGAKGFGLHPLRDATWQHEGVGRYNGGAQYLQMALEFKKRRRGNADGNLFVDESCMDCGIYNVIPIALGLGLLMHHFIQLPTTNVHPCASNALTTLLCLEG